MDAHAEFNVHQFADEVKFRFGYDHVSVVLAGESIGMWFPYRMLCDGNEYAVEMPGLPLQQIRYMGNDGQNRVDHPRIAVDGQAWLWNFAVGSCGQSSF